MDFKEIKEKTPVELQRILKADREKLRDLRFKAANKQLKNFYEIEVLKKEVARVLTALKNKVAVKDEASSKN